MMGGAFTDTGIPSWRAASIVMGKSWVPPAGPLATASAPTMTPSRSLGRVLFQSPNENEIRCQELQEPSEHHRRALPFIVAVECSHLGWQRPHDARRRTRDCRAHGNRH